MSFQNPSGSFRNEAHGGPVTVITPVTGAVIKMAANQVDLYVANAAALAALTVQLPQVLFGTKVELSFQSAVTALTVVDRFGNAIPNSPTAGVAQTAIVMRYLGRSTGWVRWR